MKDNWYSGLYTYNLVDWGNFAHTFFNMADIYKLFLGTECINSTPVRGYWTLDDKPKK